MVEFIISIVRRFLEQNYGDYLGFSYKTDLNLRYADKLANNLSTLYEFDVW